MKFKDADLIGIPFRINVGKKVTEDTVEVVRRSTLERQDVKISAISEYFRELRQSWLRVPAARQPAERPLDARAEARDSELAPANASLLMATLKLILGFAVFWLLALVG